MTQVQREVMPPTISPETAHFWEAARNGKLALRYCRSCKQHHYYPRSICPLCFSDETEWRDSPGRGVIHSFSVMRKAPVPYAIAYIELAEGTMMLSNVINCDLDALAIGQRVRLQFLPFDGGALPVFEPDDAK
ncbi:Zn-ribbon domain-containing OB-fold protein [Ferrovibrio terrae]|uniref:Zn-ribbon domain-containing OB-fold protein n=1 Tax=Ferrovibrio terrae TaxID=2594003 RepID=A0A516H190_9PROT|nr:Zn-ribbon domain-containing OB-fold protein [Ferrovibrio terrae]QDO97538.1 Zn-ribbon domain-containing OB-fold protein [Ferrovibrio terrae]